MQNFLLSVCLITYNQEDYIEKAIENIFNQEVNFSIELIICNDCSPDNSHEKIKEIIKKAPKNIDVKYFNHQENLGAMKNFEFAINKCTGKYIAYFEGDDYWDSKKKLQTQVDFLEQNPDFAICFHNLKILEENKILEKVYIDDINLKVNSSIEDLARFNYIPTLTAVFRNIEHKLPTWIDHSPIGDLPLFMMVAKYGKIKYINEKWAIYRKNIGIWNKMGNKRNMNMIILYNLLIKEFDKSPTITRNLKFAKNKYIKDYLKKEKISFFSLLKNNYYKQLTLCDKTKIIFRKYLI